MKVAEKLNLRHLPSAYQIRFQGCKGVVSIDPTLKSHHLILRKSMCKFKSSHPDFEVVTWSSPIPPYLNRQIIMLLLGRVANRNIFFQKQSKQLDDCNKMFQDVETAINMMKKMGCAYILPLQILANGFSLHHQFIQDVLFLVYQRTHVDLRRRARVLIEHGRVMIGILDESGVLEEGEVFIRYSKEFSDPGANIINHVGPVMITKSPSLHPGDIRQFTAVKMTPALEVYGYYDVVVFPQKGRRPHVRKYYFLFSSFHLLFYS